MEANAIRAAVASEIARFPEFAGTHIEFEQKAEADYEMHLQWAADHPGQEPSDRAYFLLRAESPAGISEPVLREAESTVTDWIDSTYNADSDKVAEVQWGSYAGTKLLN